MNHKVCSQNISLFTLGKVVAFPGHQMRFHIFEPRYRSLVKYCAQHDTYVGVPLGTLVKNQRKGQSLKDFLNSNQENYEPANIFGAGPMEIQRTLPDGRYEICVAIRARFKTVEVIQQLPFQLVRCTPWDDCEIEETLAQSTLVQFFSVLRFLVQHIPGLSNAVRTLERALEEQSSATMRLTYLVWQVVPWLQLPAEINQQILEEQNVLRRAETVLQTLAGLLSHNSLAKINEKELEKIAKTQSHEDSTSTNNIIPFPR